MVVLIPALSSVQGLGYRSTGADLKEAVLADTALQEENMSSHSALTLAESGLQAQVLPAHLKESAP